MRHRNKKPYQERTDIERIQSNWKKIDGLLSRKEWPVAIARAATAAEIAANLAIRHELQEQRGLEADFVNHLLIWANGLSGKLDKLLRPLHTTKERETLFKELKRRADKINKERNSVVHSGEFKNKKEAQEIVTVAKEFVEKLVSAYHDGFVLKNQQTTKLKRAHKSAA